MNGDNCYIYFENIGGTNIISIGDKILSNFYLLLLQI